jgi:hypothetical protein
VVEVKGRCGSPSESVAKEQGIAFQNQKVNFRFVLVLSGTKKERNKVNSEMFMIDSHRAPVRKEYPKDFRH